MPGTEEGHLTHHRGSGIGVLEDVNFFFFFLFVVDFVIH